jgi:hypothetical protein
MGALSLDLHIRRRQSFTNRYKINSQGYWFESNRGSTKPQVRLLMGALSSSMSHEKPLN